MGNPDPYPNPLYRGENPNVVDQGGTSLTANKIPKASDGNTLVNSNFADDGTSLNAANANGPALPNEATSGSNPTLCSDRTSLGDGIGNDAGGGACHLIVAGASVVQAYPSNVFYYAPPVPSSSGSQPCGSVGRPWGTVNGQGSRNGFVTSAAATLAGTNKHHYVKMTAATAAYTLPDASDVGEGFEIEIIFTGATSRTITPASGDTSAVTSPTQNQKYKLISDGVTNWEDWS